MREGRAMGGSPSTAVGGEPQNHKKLHGFVLKTKDNRRHDDPLSQNRVGCAFAMSACEKGEQWEEALQLLSGDQITKNPRPRGGGGLLFVVRDHLGSPFTKQGELRFCHERMREGRAMGGSPSTAVGAAPEVANFREVVEVV